MRRTVITLALAAALSACATAPVAPVAAPAIKRTFDSASPIPIASSVFVPADSDMLFISGMLPAVANRAAPAGSIESFGPDTKTQALSVLAKLKAALATENMTFADVTTVRVFLVGDPKLGGRMDFAGFNEAFRTEFATPEQPNRPSRTVVQVVALPAPGALVEVDLIAARPKAP